MFQQPQTLQIKIVHSNNFTARRYSHPTTNLFTMHVRALCNISRIFPTKVAVHFKISLCLSVRPSTCNIWTPLYRLSTHLVPQNFIKSVTAVNFRSQYDNSNDILHVNWTNRSDTHRAPFIVPTKCTFLISTNIKWASATCFGTRVLCSGRTQWQILNTKRYCEAVIYRLLSAASLLLGLTVRSSYNGTWFKAYGYRAVTGIAYRYMTCIQMY
jgi:hypothetical protein